MSENKTIFNWQFFLGFVLVVAGGLFLADQLFAGAKLMEQFWPLLIVLLGLTFFVGMLVAGKRGSGLAIPGSIITTLGLLLFIQNLFSLWETWAYAWALLISSVGFGMLIMNFFHRRLTLRRVAGLIIGIGLILFVVFGVLFEVVFFRNSDSGSGYFLGAGLVLLGLFVLLSRPLFAKRKEKLTPEGQPVPEEQPVETPVDVAFTEVESMPEPSGQAVSENPEGVEFTGLNFKSVGEIILTQGESCDLKIEGNEEVIEDIQTEVANDFLVITYKPDVKDWKKLVNLQDERNLRYFITMKDVVHLDMAGAGSLLAEGLHGQSPGVTHKGLGQVTVKDLNYQSLDVDLGGLGEIILDGEVQDQNVSLGGAGSYKAENLKSQEANVTLTGAGSARVWAESALNANVSGAGSIRYKGEPKVEKSKTGLGSIEPLT